MGLLAFLAAHVAYISAMRDCEWQPQLVPLFGLVHAPARVTSTRMHGSPTRKRPPAYRQPPRVLRVR